MLVTPRMTAKVSTAIAAAVSDCIEAAAPKMPMPKKKKIGTPTIRESIRIAMIRRPQTGFPAP